MNRIVIFNFYLEIDVIFPKSQHYTDMFERAIVQHDKFIKQYFAYFLFSSEENENMSDKSSDNKKQNTNHTDILSYCKLVFFLMILFSLSNKSKKKKKFYNNL